MKLFSRIIANVSKDKTEKADLKKIIKLLMAIKNAAHVRLESINRHIKEIPERPYLDGIDKQNLSDIAALLKHMNREKAQQQEKIRQENENGKKLLYHYCTRITLVPQDRKRLDKGRNLDHVIYRDGFHETTNPPSHIKDLEEIEEKIRAAYGFSKRTEVIIISLHRM